MKVIYCGFGRAGLEVFYQLYSNIGLSPADIIVFTHEKAENNEFIQHLNNNKIEYYFDNVNKHYERLEGFSPDCLLSVYYRFIIKKPILELVNYKAMNAHPSLLPKYRGTKSSVWAIINNEKETGISYHYMNEKIDDGNIILQKKINIESYDTAYSIYHKLISLFIDNFQAAFKLMVDGFNGEQQVGEPSYYPRELPFNGVKKFSEVSFDEASRFVKAMYFPPFQGALFEKNNGDQIEITDVSELEKYKGIIGQIK